MVVNGPNNEVLELDLSHFDTSNVTDMTGMFSGARLRSLNLTGWDVSKVVSMGGMFGLIDLRLTEVILDQGGEK